jgi:DNA adenine methylase
MKKLFKWPGGKTKELDLIVSLLPMNFDRIIEPFAGAATLSFHLEKDCILSDMDDNIINFYHVIQDFEMFQEFKALCQNAKSIPFAFDNSVEKYTIENLYYEARQSFNDKSIVNPVQRAFDFFIIRQLCFSGMIRYSKDNRFNAPYGWYKSITMNHTDNHHLFLNQKAQVFKQDFETTIKQAKENDFIFLDPPYRSRLGYDIGFTDDDHIRLANALKNTQARWLLVHSDDDLYRELYQSYDIFDQQYNYSINFRNANDSKVNHLYIKNYQANLLF